MKRALRFSVLILALLALPSVHAQGCDQPPELRGTDTPYSLWGVCLSFSHLSPGDRLPLGSIVYLPPGSKGGPLTLSIDRSALTDEFIADLFDNQKKALFSRHQLAQRGVILVLTPKHLRITVYPGVVLRLRSDIIGEPQYQTFAGHPMFVVDDVSKGAYASTDLGRISKAFSNVYFQYVLPMKETSVRTLPEGTTESKGSIQSDSLPWRVPSRADK